MSVKSVQFTVAAHIMTVLGFDHGEEISSATLAGSVNAGSNLRPQVTLQTLESGLGDDKTRQERIEHACTSSPADHAIGHIPRECGATGVCDSLLSC